MSSDPLSDVLRLANARCEASGVLRAGGAWALRFPAPGRLKVVAVVTGACWLAVDGQGAPARLATGDAVMLPADRAFELATDARAPRADGARVFAGAPHHIARVGEGDDFSAVGAHIAAGGELAAGRPPGWVGALRDVRLAPALRLMHREPGRAWRVGDLAKAAGMSRTGFAVRFRAAVGAAPLTYLLHWRMRLAMRELDFGSARRR